MGERYSTRPSVFLGLTGPNERHLAFSADYTTWATGAKFRAEEHERVMAEAGHQRPPRMLTGEEIQIERARQVDAFEEMARKVGRGG